MGYGVWDRYSKDKDTNPFFFLKHCLLFGGCTYMSFFLGKVTALGVLCCFALFVCLTLLASFFLPSHLSFKNMYYLALLHNIHVSACIFYHIYCYLQRCRV